jgi:hypothetical protein
MGPDGQDRPQLSDVAHDHKSSLLPRFTCCLSGYLKSACGAAAKAQVCNDHGMPAGTKNDPWELSTAPRTSTYIMWADETADPPTLFCQVGATQLRYQLRCLDDLHAWLAEQGDWVELGAADEQKPAKDGTVEAWGRSAGNPVGGWYGLRKGYRGRFGMYVPPLLEALGKVELTHEARNNKVRALV